MTISLNDLIAGMPKVELHMHLEGSIEPELTFQLARRNGMTLPYDSVEALRRAYDFADLGAFLKVYYAGTSVMRTADDFRDLTLDYLRRVAAQNVAHAEVFLGPQAHLERGVPIEAVFDGVIDGLQEGERRYGLTTRLLLVLQRHKGEEAGRACCRDARPWWPSIAAVGIGGIEQGYPPSDFARLFAEMRDQGFRLVAHAGEEGPAAYVAEALDVLGVDRVDHGVRAVEDPELVRRLADRGVPLTVCPLSNLRLKGVERLADHAMRPLLDAGVKVTMNSDDPSYFGGYMTENYCQTAEALNFSPAEIYRIAANGIDAAFATPAERDRLRAGLDAYWTARTGGLPGGNA